MDAKVEVSDIPDTEELNRLIMRVMKNVNAQAFSVFGSRVLEGPFRGMIIPENSPWADGNSGSKLFGCYEYELHPAIDHARWRNPSVVINVGCAEGYYAIGFARIGGLFVYGIDICDESLNLCREYAKLNSAKVELFNGAYSPEELRLLTAPRGHRFYFIDCEGAEVDLIDLDRCPEFRCADIIVECHDFIRFGASRTIADRLSRTHRVDLIRQRLPDLRQFQFLERFPTVLSVLAVVEKRPTPCYWLACWANSRGVSNG